MKAALALMAALARRLGPPDRTAPGPRRAAPSWRLIGGAAAVGLALAGLTVFLAGPWDAGQRVAERRSAAAYDGPDGPDGPGGELPGGDTEIIAGIAVAEPVLAPLSPAKNTAPAGGTGASAAARALTAALAPALDDPALGPGATGSVVDAATGTPLFGDGARTPMTPASTVKLVTAVAALDLLGPDHRLVTTTRWDAARDRVVLVGGGDPTLRSGDLARLAERTAKALADQGVDRAAVAYDVSLYPTQRHPIGVNENIAPITPLQVDAGRLDGSEAGPAPRATDPAADAAAAFAGHLADAGVRVTGSPTPQRAGGAGEASGSGGSGERLATHRSAPLSSLVEEMLTNSDNDLAEALGRHAAIADGRAGDFRGVRQTITRSITDLGLPAAGVRVADASGLDRGGRLTAELLTSILALAADPDRPALRPALTGLPVAGFSGTLADRYDPDAGTPAGAGAGLVRAKTGTLTGVNTLAGTAITPDGRLVVFAFLGNDTTDPFAAQAALDDAAATLASCACLARH